ncbi:unnamed protein product [Thelazia callipaeda]|uniref:KH_10 domain-containing protein n=1 Tax=Thelazia callipaeda TaxID=103827 RepID=A0A0N5CJL0_THECL|nr:unnamed protein product [Thelazia callipaeda]
MFECIPLKNMPVGGHWTHRGGFTLRAFPRRFDNNFDMFRHAEITVGFYHRSQESGKMFHAMKQKTEFAFEQRRNLEAIRLRNYVDVARKQKSLERASFAPLTNDVALAIEVPCLEYAGMMERKETWFEKDSIPKIMHDTGVLIQFPDLIPDIENANDHINRVILYGPLSNVEQARVRIRNLTPVAVSFPLKALKPDILLKDVRNIIDEAIAGKIINFPDLQILVQFQQPSDDQVPMCVVRGPSYCEGDICNACTALHRLLFDAADDSEHSSATIYSTIMNIPAIQQTVIVGVPDAFLIRLISLETNAIIYFPTIADRNYNATLFHIHGAVRSILQARKFIQGLLPVCLTFDVENDDLLSPIDASNRDLFMRDVDRDLTVTVNKSRLEGQKITENDTLRHMITIKSEEYNLTNVYATRHQLFRKDIAKEEPFIMTKDFEFFEQDFRTLIAKNNQVIAEISPEIFKPSRIYMNNILADTSVAVPIANISASQGIITNDTIFTTKIPSLTLKEQKQSDAVNITVPQLLNLFRYENKDAVITATDSPEKPSPAVPVLHVNGNNAYDGHNKHFDRRCSDEPVKKTSCDSIGSMISDNTSESKYRSEKLSVHSRSSAVPSQSQDMISYRNKVVNALINEQGSATVAVAAAMLQNSPPQWFQSASTMAALKSADYFGQLPRMVEQKTVPENFALDYQREKTIAGAKISARADQCSESNDVSSDIRLTSLSKNRDINPLCLPLRDSSVQKSNQYRLLNQGIDNTGDNYRGRISSL